MKFVIASLLFASLFLNISSGPTFLNNDPMLNPDLFEGDIAGDAEADLKGLARNPDRSYGKWTNGIVPYVIDANTYTSAQLNVITQGMKWIQDQTRVNGRDCIKFVPRTNEATYLRIHSGSGCWSYVGKQASSGAQLVSIQKPATASSGHCVYAGTVAHELIHALGFYHEQSRPDRDNFVTINYQNIISGQEHNFNKYTTGVDTLGLPYDLYSIMHYEWNAFSKNGQATVVAKQGGVNLVNAAYKTALTSIDANELRKFYGCS